MFQRVLRPCSSASSRTIHARFYVLTLLRSWLVNLSTVAGFFGWWSINLTYIFFCKLFPPVYNMTTT